MRPVLLLLLPFSLPVLVDARVQTVFIWDALPGYEAEMYQTAYQAKPLHEKLGAVVFIGTDERGRMHYALEFNSAEERGRFEDRVAESRALEPEAARYRGTARLESIHRIRELIAPEGSVGNVLVVHQWRPRSGRTQDFMKHVRHIRSIHQEMGATVLVQVDHFGLVHYVTSFPSWQAHGKFADKLQADPKGSALADETNAVLADVARITVR